MIYSKLLIVSFVILSLFLTLNNSGFAQAYSTVSKSCGKCGKIVSSSAKVGDTCPYCGVRWGSENSQTSTSYHNAESQTLYRKSINEQSKRVKNNETDEKIDDSKATKHDTEEWILSKLKQYTKPSYHSISSSAHIYKGISGGDFVIYDNDILSHQNSGYYSKNFIYYFDEYNLVIEFENEDDGNAKTVYKRKWVIPIYDISKVLSAGSSLWIYSKNKTMIEYGLTENSKKTDNIYYFDFDTEAETDLCERLDKAFLHLKKFYKKPVSKEAF